MDVFSKTNPLMALLLRSLLRLGIACALLAMVPTFEGSAFAQQQTQDDPVRATLAQFGKFVAHPKYGEVWTPTATPPDWHPYAPCNWVNSKVGWYYNDTTPWGAIVHHYGRWTHDEQIGWIWIPGAEFSPGWVVWRADRQWIGWAPMPPDEEMQTISSDSFNKGDTWIFQDISTFEHGCSGPAQIAPRDHIAALLIATTFITEIEIIDGIAIYVLPPFEGGNVVDIDFSFQPWAPAFFAQVLIDWNFIWNNLNVAGAPCPPGAPGPGPQAGAGNPPPGGGGQPGGGNPAPGGGQQGSGFPTCPDGSPLPPNNVCPVKTVATCFNGLLPPSLCQNFPIVCGAGQHALGNTCVANVVCTPPATPDSSGIGCVTPDPPTKVAGGGCNGPNGAYAGCSGGGVGGPGGPPSGGGGAPGGSGCAAGSTFNDISGTCTEDSAGAPVNDQTCDMKITSAKVCAANNVTCGVPGLKPCGPGNPTPHHCINGTWQYSCDIAGGTWAICGAGYHPVGKICVANVVCVLPQLSATDGASCVTPAAQMAGGPSSSASGCGESSTLGQNGACKGVQGTRTINDQTCDMKITSAKVCVAKDVTCGAPGELPCGPGQKLPVLCWDGTYQFSCPVVKASATDCGPLGHWSGSDGCVVNVTCTPPAITSPDGTQCLDAMADKQGPRPTPSPSPTIYTTFIAPTCCALVHPSYAPPIVVIATPTPRPVATGTGTPTSIPTYRPVTAATGTPTPTATYSYRPPPREPLPATILERKPDIGREPPRPVEAISHGGGGQNTYAAKPMTTTTNSRPSFVSNTPAQPFRAPPTAFVHPMPTVALARPACRPVPGRPCP